MAASNVISVNPGQKTLGALHPEVLARLARRRIDISAAKNNAAKTLNLIFAVKEAKGNRRSMLLLVARIIVGFLFILSGYAGLTQGLAPVSYIQPHEYGIIMIVLGSMLGVGLFTRPVFLLGFLAWATASVVQAISGVISMESCLWAACSMIFCFTGAGRWSLDMALRHIVYTTFFGRRRETRQARQRLSYKAFSYNH